ncbi:MAG: PTS sugar transporter subunit IIB [Brevinema sp.]
MKVLVSCVSGMGSSQMIKMKINKVFTKLGLVASIDHMSVGEAKSVANNYDVIFCSLVLVDNFKVKDTTKVIGLKNLLSEVEIEDAIKSQGLI